MALSDEVIARVPTQTLVSLTRRKSVDATTVDSTLLTKACDDVEDAHFPTYVQVVYDGTNAQHVAVAVQGVVALLRKWAREGQRGGNAEWDRWVTDAAALKNVTSRDRIMPLTTSDLTPATEVEPGTEQSADFDHDKWDDYVPKG
jgi:hypothetical protein